MSTGTLKKEKLWKKCSFLNALLENMAPNNLITIIRNQIQDSWSQKMQCRERLGVVEKNLEVVIQSLGVLDDRRVSGIDISQYRDNLESFLKKHFDISEKDLETKDEKERFDLELERAKITIELEELETRIEHYNKRIMQIDSDFKIFGPENYEPKNLETYVSLITLEKTIRDSLLNFFESKGIENWWQDFISEEKRDMAQKGFDEEISKFGFSQNEIRRIDFLDFSAYEEIFKGRKSKKLFFNGSDEKQWSLITKLSELRPLRNKIVHRPPLDDEELIKFRACHNDIMSFARNLNT
jgi:hypothetical protein